LSNERTALSDDIVRLRHARLSISIRDGHLAVNNVPYLTSSGEILRGQLVAILKTAPTGETVPPDDHRVWLSGNIQPCEPNGTVVDFICENRTFEIIPGLTVCCGLSLVPRGSEKYSDYFQMMMTYVDELTGIALTVNSDVTAQSIGVVSDESGSSPFVYEDTASTRAGIRAISAKLELSRVAIVGMGGTGSYILDLLAKCPIGHIHIFDGDVFEQHTAFRTPGAAAIADLEAAPLKVEYLAAAYGRMHLGIVQHPHPVDLERVEELRDMDFVFLSLGDGRAREMIVDHLVEFGIEFIDAGLSVSEIDGALSSMLRTTTSLRTHREEARDLLTFSDGEAENLYSRNIQVADLNCLNAALAVGRFKRWCGFYIDHEGEVESLYMTVGNAITNTVPGVQ